MTLFRTALVAVFATMSACRTAQSRPDLPAQENLESDALAAVVKACPDVSLRFDPDLGLAAREYVDAASKGTAPVSGSALGFQASLDSDAPGPIAAVATVVSAGKASRGFAVLTPRTCTLNRIAAAAARMPDGSVILALITSFRSAELARIPGAARIGQTVDVDGTLSDSLTGPRLYIGRPSGAVDEIPLTVSAARFRASVSLASQGKHTIQVVASGPQGPTIVAQRLVFVEVQPPVAPARVPLGPRLEELETAIAKLRAQRGLSSLERDPILDEVAKAHSQAMVDRSTFATRLPDRGDIGRQLAERDYPYRSVGINIAQSDDVTGIYEAIVDSPANLLILTEPQSTRLGIGLAKAAFSGGDVFASILLTSPVEQSTDLAGDIFRSLAARREERALSPLQRDPGLDLIAAAEVRKAIAANDKTARADVARRVLDDRDDLESAVFEVHVGGAIRPMKDASKNAVVPRWTRIGIGAAHGPSKNKDPGWLWVVVIYAR